MLGVNLHIALFVGVAMLAYAPAAASAANCGPEPSVSGPSSFSRWRAWCIRCGGNPPTYFEQAKDAGCPLPRGSGSSSVWTPRGGSLGATIGSALGTALGTAINRALFGDPAARARAKAQAIRAERERRRAEERAAEAAKNRLLGGMMNVDPSPPLAHLGGRTRPGLVLMTDDAPAIAPAAKRAARAR